MNNYAAQERAKWWPVPAELMAQYCDGSHTENDFGHLVWIQHKQYHRDGDRPAWIGISGNLEWYTNGLRHRYGDRPAFIGRNGYLEWRQYGQQHRLNGPALIYESGEIQWVIYDEVITQEVNEWLAGEEWQGTPEQIERFQRKFL